MCVRFGLPFVLHLEKTIAWDLLQKEILEKMKYFLRPTVCIQVGQHLDTAARHACVPGEETVPARKSEFWTSALREERPDTALGCQGALVQSCLVKSAVFTCSRLRT